MNKEKISLILITCDRPQLFQRALQSCLQQSSRDFEIIVVDDGLTPAASEAQVKSFGQDVTYIATSGRQGAPVARNLGISHAKGEWITFLDDDDYLLPDRIKNFYELIATRSSQFSLFGTTTVNCIDGAFQRFKGDQGGVFNLNQFFDKCVVGISVLARKTQLVAVGMFDEQMTGSQDWELWIRVVQRFGPMLKVDSFDYVVTADSADRITTSPRKALGFQRLVSKHRAHMSARQAAKFEWLSKYATRAPVRITDVLSGMLETCSLAPLKIFVKLCVGK